MAICESDQTVLESELMILKEVYFNELESISSTVDGTVINVVIKPNTCDDPERQFIKFLLRFVCSHHYPSVPPLISIEKPRGLTEEEVITLTKDLEKIADEKVGDPMLFDIVLFAKEFITDQNIPHTVCSICLDGFSSEKEIFKTPQFHFYHNKCIANFVRYETDKHRVQVDELLSYDPYIKDLPELSILCPLCREEQIECSPEFVKTHDTPFETVDVVIPEEWKRKSKELQALFEKQLRMTEEAVSNSSRSDETSTASEKVNREYSDANSTEQTKASQSENCNLPEENYEKHEHSQGSGGFRGAKHEFRRSPPKPKRGAEQRYVYPQRMSRNHYIKGASLKVYDAKPRSYDRMMTNKTDTGDSHLQMRVSPTFESNDSSSKSYNRPNRRENFQDMNTFIFENNRDIREKPIPHHYPHPSQRRGARRSRGYHERTFYDDRQGTSQRDLSDSYSKTSDSYHHNYQGDRRRRDYFQRDRNSSMDSYNGNCVRKSDSRTSGRNYVQSQSFSIENENVSQGD